MKERLMIVAGTLVLVATIIVTLLAPTSIAAPPKGKTKEVFTSVAFFRSKVVEHRTATWYWQDTMFRSRTPSAGQEQNTKSRRYLKWLARKWYDRRVEAKKRAENPPHLNEWLCIHKYEGAWNDPNAPYYGGLQMDMSFQRSYGWR